MGNCIISKRGSKKIMFEQITSSMTSFNLVDYTYTNNNSNTETVLAIASAIYDSTKGSQSSSTTGTQITLLSLKGNSGDFFGTVMIVAKLSYGNNVRVYVNGSSGSGSSGYGGMKAAYKIKVV